MRFLNDLCPPALLYAAFLVVGLGFDLADLRIVTVLGKILFGGATVYVLDLLCRVDLGVVSWFIVAIPFIVTALATSIAMGMNLDAQVAQLLAGKTNPPAKKDA
jgi:hypothetical protein